LYQAEKNAPLSIIPFGAKYCPPSRPQQPAFEVSLAIYIDWRLSELCFHLLIVLHNETGKMLSLAEEEDIMFLRSHLPIT